MTTSTLCNPWPVSYAGCGSQDVMEALEDEQRATFETMAGDYLWNWTGQRFGLCPVLIRPCRATCDPAGSTYWGRGPYPNGTGAPWEPVLIAGRWFNLACGVCGSECSCGAETPALVLPGPVDSITTVTIDGEVIDPATYVLDGNLLRRLDGGWPVCQDQTLALTEPGTWAVEYQRGTPVPEGGRVAAGVLAMEFAKAACNDTTCALPKRVQSITRQGVTVAILDAFDDIDKGHTGIWVIDAWIASVTKAQTGGTVTSPDLRRRGRSSLVQPAPPPVP